MCFTSDPIKRIDPVALPPPIDAELLTELTRVVSHGLSVPNRFTADDMNTIDNLGSALPSEWGAVIRGFVCAWQQAMSDRTRLSVAFCRLFQGPFEIAAPPYASFYLESDRRPIDSIRDEVERAYHDAGLVAGDEPHELPDHAALQWEFVYYLSYQHGATRNADWLDRRDDFVNLHLRPWMPAFAGRIRSAGIHPYYDRWATLALATLHQLPHRLIVSTES